MSDLRKVEAPSVVVQTYQIESPEAGGWYAFGGDDELPELLVHVWGDLPHTMQFRVHNVTCCEGGAVRVGGFKGDEAVELTGFVAWDGCSHFVSDQSCMVHVCGVYNWHAWADVFRAIPELASEYVERWSAEDAGGPS